MGNSDLVVSAPRVGMAGELHEISANIRGPEIDQRIWFRSKTSFASEPSYAPEAFMATALFAAMRLGLQLRVEAPVSAQLLENLEEYQRINCRWYPLYQQIEIIPEQLVRDKRGGEGMASFFTGGVDSFHTALAYPEELTHSLFLYGADIKLEEVAYRALVSEQLGKATRELGTEFIEVESNMLDFTEEYGNWPQQFHGAGLVATSMLFSDRYSTVAIASSYALHELVPWGSHPATDPLWSSPGFQVIHHGVDCDRFDKVARVTQNDTALRYLRVCWENVEESYNCCVCEKCLRTMVALRIAGTLESSSAFPLPLDISLLPKVRYTSEGNRNDWKANIRAASRGDDAELVEALEQLVLNNEIAAANRQFARLNKGMIASPQWQKKLPKVRNKLWRSLAASDKEWFAGKIGEAAGDHREQAFSSLWRRHRKWLKREVAAARRRGLRERMRSGLRRLGIGRKS